MLRFVGYFVAYCIYIVMFVYAVFVHRGLRGDFLDVVGYSLPVIVLWIPFLLSGYAINNVRFVTKGRAVMDIALVAVIPLVGFLAGGPLAKIILSYAVFAAFWIALAHFFPIRSWTKG